MIFLFDIHTKNVHYGAKLESKSIPKDGLGKKLQPLRDASNSLQCSNDKFPDFFNGSNIYLFVRRMWKL